MYPCQDPRINHRILQDHPYPVDFSAKKEQREPHVGAKKTSSFGGTSMLPPEVWAEVFLYCLPEPPPANGPHPWYNRDRYISPLTAPLLLCQVCRRWREIAVTMPRLWQRLGVYVSMGTACPAPGLADLWLSRSGSLPLILSLHQQNESNLNALVAGRILVLFIKHTSRWMDVDLYLAGSRLVLTSTSSNPVDAKMAAAPILQRFRLRTSSRVYEKEERYIFGVIQDVPRLNDLHISRVPELDLLGNSTVDVPWHQLGSLALDYVPSIGTSLHVLSKCERLEECTIKADALFGPLFQEPLVHTSLRSLSINIGCDHFTAFFSRATLPALRDLSIQIRGPLEHYGWPQPCFEEFLSRSECRLARLEIRDSGMRADQFAMCLQHRFLQDVEELVIDDRRDWTWDPFVKDLAFDLMNCSRSADTYAALVVLEGGYIADGAGADGGTEVDNGSGAEDGSNGNSVDGNGRLTRGRVCFLPKLLSLVVRGNCMQTSDGTISDMVESRFYFHEQNVEKLRSLKLDIPSSHLGDLQRLKWMETEGLDLDLAFI